MKDLLNERIIAHKAQSLGQKIYQYHLKDTIEKVAPNYKLQKQFWKLGSNHTDDAFGKLPLFCGIKVMILENLAFSYKVVNGAKGIV